MFLIVGLGNPGDKYKKNRHNVGFILLDFIFSDFEMDKYSNSLVAREEISGKGAVLAKPQTFMNESGRAVFFLKDKYEIKNENILVVYDDVDLPFGDVRVSFDRGSGGHNGIKSLTADLGGQDFLRVRVGVAPKDETGKAIKPKGGFFTPASKAVANYVLKDFSSTDLEKLKNLSQKIEKIIKTFVQEGREKVMNEFN